MVRPAIFLDRDGTLNIEKEYLFRIDDWEWIPGAVEAIKLINMMGYLAVVVTNQAGVARGYYDEEDILELHRQVDKMLAAEGAWIDAYYYCPHHSEYGSVQGCGCRKPAHGMLLAARRDLHIDLAKSFMIGDKAIDVAAGVAAGVTPVLVMTGYGRAQSALVDISVHRSAAILDACQYIEKVRLGLQNGVQSFQDPGKKNVEKFSPQVVQ
ncbi:D-glycero-beta-D-manno-heptose 1,7-bisphosphate 7-phosphatase [Methylomonas rivi]|uniref:D,D-heptose 1,7-bisphosphate phosphatase n=1 Tax=Methylomonas rivi TaxID=2952226 RepID=A0ABT1U0T1_9GAMM|nr:D-glycero-beta-D-manno-heptose 1,7-bisphosphate 7-phosphatase [Methylomonas sp. WSC-6]MCQ8127411.1 D-glycero-beta-D-manno-heptose 1,7-bisphosphate 7-phosphatase [Methylomonas sp. WSC-6]